MGAETMMLRSFWRCCTGLISVLTIILFGFCCPAFSHSGHKADGVASEIYQDFLPNIPDSLVVDQFGTSVKFHSDLVKNKIVVIDFVFTNCSTTCPVLTAKLQAVQNALKAAGRNSVQFISISVDPTHDTPDVLKAYADDHGISDNWRFVTSAQNSLQPLLAAFGAPANAQSLHSDFIVIGNDRIGKWTRRAIGTSVEDLVAEVQSLADDPSSTSNSGERYFGNLTVTDQNGKSHRFYDDFIRGRVVLINFIFTKCADICPVATDNLVRARKLFVSEGLDIKMVSITIDPENDKPAALKSFAVAHAADQWSFITGNKKNIDWITRRLGAAVDVPQEHSTVLIVGNDKTGDWRKLIVTETPSTILEHVKAVMAKEVTAPKPSIISRSESLVKGKNIYHFGRVDSAVSVTLDSVPVASTSFACGNCHGSVAEGKPEGLQRIPPISWSYLSSTSSPASKPKAFDRQSFGKLLRDGVGLSGKKISNVMPQYQFSDAEVASLVDYLSVVGTAEDIDSGVSDDAIRLGASLPLTGANARAGVSIQKTLEQQFSSINASGGVYGRKIELVVRDSGISQAEHEAAVQHLIENDKVFALVGDLGIGSVSTELHLGVPILQAFEPPVSESHDNKYPTFYLLSSLANQTRLLVDYAEAQGHRRAIVITSDSPRSRQALKGFNLQIQSNTIEVLKTYNLDNVPAEFTSFQEDVLKLHPDVIFYLSDERDFKNTTNSISLAQTDALLMAPAMSLGAGIFDLAPALAQRSRFSLPFDPQFYDGSPLEIMSRAAATVAIEGIQRSGKNLTRAVFADALRVSRGFHANGLPVLSFGDLGLSNQMSRIVSVDLDRNSFKSQSDWISPGSVKFVSQKIGETN
jgi:protein SCO1